jgi:septum site-determining protein MinC
MPVAIAGRAPATFEIKSANLPLVALLLKSHDMTQLAQELEARFGELPEFFDNDPLVVDLGPLKESSADIDFAALLALLRRYRVLPVAARGGSGAQMQAALKAGLAPAPDVIPAPASAATPAGKGARPAPLPEPPAALTTASAMVIDKPLRSGQQVYARGRDLVVLSMVNPGAEVIADGHIHVYAPLRGKAMAGARGFSEARILTLCLEPELVSIAGVYRTSEVPLPKELVGKPAQVRLAGGADAGKLVLEPLKN